MVAVAKQDRRFSKGSRVPAKKPVPTETYSQRVSAQVRKLRVDRGWTVADLAERINRHLDPPLANSTIHGWDNGSGKIDPDAYPALAKVFGMPVREFLPAR